MASLESLVDMSEFTRVELVRLPSREVAHLGAFFHFFGPGQAPETGFQGGDFQIKTLEL